MDLKNLQGIAISAALAAGKKILEVYESDDFDVSLKDDNSPLTKADLVSQATIEEILETQAPGIPVLGEESKEITYSDREKWKVFWLVDPLDGTKEFVKRNGEFTVNIALVENGVAILGVLYVPVTDTIYFAAVGTADVYPRFGPTMEWDVGAGQVIAEEAGCRLVDTDTGEPLRYNKANLVNPYFIVKR